MNLIIGFLTYPRPDKSTYGLLEKTFKSVIANQDLSEFNIRCIVVGDDYPNITELSPIFEGYCVEFHNINTGDAMRHKKIPHVHIWHHAVTRSCICIFEKVKEYSDSVDYLLLSADDEEYINYKLLLTEAYAIHYKQPDLIFSRGITFTGEAYPPMDLPYPMTGLVIASGVCYKVKRSEIVQDILQFRKTRWEKVCEAITTGVFDGIAAEDAEVWDYLEDKFKENIYTSVMIKECTINHYTQGTILRYLEQKQIDGPEVSRV